ncbi:MAG TPA: hypothetical protein VF329_08440 [Gammaproteobacteria bacterium]
MTVDQNGGLTILSQTAPSGRRDRKPLVEGFKLHRVGVEIEDWVDQRSWYEFGKLLQQVDYAWEWMVADWLAFGDHKYGDHVYAAAARLFGKAARTWEDYAYIARNVRISERSEILPVLTHKPLARFGEDPALQRRLVAIAEQHNLSKAVFERVIDLYLQRKPYGHLLPSQMNAITRARLRAEKERERVRKQASVEGGHEWLAYAREQANGWKRLVSELTKRAAKP